MDSDHNWHHAPLGARVSVDAAKEADNLGRVPGMTMLPGPEKDVCGGDQERCTLPACPLYGTLGRPGRDGNRRVRGCQDPTARGRRNRRSGLAKQRTARKALGVAPQKFGDANEEKWVDPLFANEVKSGKQCGPLANWWTRVEAQVVANEAESGDRRRPVRGVAMPEGWGADGLVVVRLSTWSSIIVPALEAQYGPRS